MSGRVDPLNKKIAKTYFDAVNNMKFTNSGETSTKSDVITNLNHNIKLFGEIKSQINALFMDSGDKFNYYNEKLKNSKQEHSKKLYQKKVDRYRNEVLELLQKMETIDNSIKNLESTIEKLLKEETVVTEDTST